MRIGVFGGTFDPPHIGHLIVAQEVHSQLHLDRLLFMPAAVPPHKRDREVTPGEVRLQLVRAAIEGDDRFEAHDLEIRRGGPSYTADTLRQLATEYQGADLFLALGVDQYAVLGTWKDPSVVARLAILATFARAGERVQQDPAWPAHVVNVPRIDVTSTEIRRRRSESEPLSFLVPRAVEALVLRMGLYTRTGRS